MAKQSESARTSAQQKKDAVYAGKRAKAQERFLAAYAEHATITDAANEAKVGRRTHYDWLKQDAEYSKRFEEAKDSAIDSLEREARRRALAGSDTLLIFLLKGHKPETYRERQTIEHSGSLDLAVAGERVDRLLASLAAAKGSGAPPRDTE